MMYSKKITIISLLLLCSAPLLFATGAGVQFGANPGLLINQDTAKLEKFSATATGTLRFSRLPLALGCGFEAGLSSSDFAYGLSGFADYYALDIQLKNTWNLVSGFGLSGSLLTSDFKDFDAAAGARFFLGMNWLFWDNYLEYYVQQNVVPTITSKKDFLICLPFETGIRMHF